MSDEILYFVKGTGECVVGLEKYSVRPGDFVLVPKDTPHSIRNTHALDDMISILAQSPLPCEHVPVDTGEAL